MNLQNKVAIITGASKGIGKSIAHALGLAGAKVVISSRNQAQLDEVVAAFATENIEAKAIAAHSGKLEDLTHLVDETIRTFGRIDIIVNNAATNPVFGPIEDCDGKAFDKIMEVNVKGVLTLSQLAFPHLKAVGGGSIINISSVEGTKPSQGLGIYSVSKAALIQLTKAMALEWGQHNIRVNALCPGLIQTKFSEALWQNEQILKHFLKNVPLQRMGQPDEMSGIVLLLASEQGAYITGSIINADGGYLI
jgi:dehydrogenase/reductase SDR family member 4